MKPLEIWTGTQPERAANARVSSMKRKHLTRSQDVRLQVDSALASRLQTRRNIIKTGGAIGIVGAIGIGGFHLLRSAENEGQSVDVYDQYLQAFQQYAMGDIEAEELLNFVNTEVRRASVDEDGVLHAEGSEDLHRRLVVAVLPRADKESDAFYGEPLLRLQSSPDVAVLYLKNVAVESQWGGPLFARHAEYARQSLLSPPLSERDRTEVEYLGYSLQFLLLNKASETKFSQSLTLRVKRVSRASEVFSFVQELSDDDYYALSSAFEPAKSKEEQVVRKEDLLIAFNFANIDNNFVSPEERKLYKIEYLSQRASG